jgi:hypothetical protein
LGIDGPAGETLMRRLALLVPVALLAALTSVAPVAPLVSGCAAAGSHHASLVVEHGDGSVVTRCVAFDASSVSGEELLNLSGVAWSSRSFAGFGDAVCALDGEPAEYVDCPGQGSYWAVFVARDGGSWQLASVGISTLALHDGDAEGFRYVPASGVPAVPVSAAGACAAAATPAPRRSAASGAPAPQTAGSTPGGAATSAATRAPRAPAPAPSGGVDPGLLAAALAGGGLAGLAILRLAFGRRPGR